MVWFVKVLKTSQGMYILETRNKNSEFELVSHFCYSVMKILDKDTMPGGLVRYGKYGKFRG